MFRKLLIASAVLALTSSVAFAHNYKGDYKGEACPTYNFLAGPYVGLSVGPKVIFTGAPAVYHGFEGTLSAGYAAMMNPMFYLAGELFVQDSAKFKNYTAPGAGSVRTRWGWGASILPGYMVNDHALAFLRLGVVDTRFSSSHSSHHSSNNNGRWGGQIGLGGQTNICGNWDLRGETVYSQYKRVSHVGRPRGYNFNVGIVYKFV